MSFHKVWPVSNSNQVRFIKTMETTKEHLVPEAPVEYPVSQEGGENHPPDSAQVAGSTTTEEIEQHQEEESAVTSAEVAGEAPAEEAPIEPPSPETTTAAAQPEEAHESVEVSGSEPTGEVSAESAEEDSSKEENPMAALLDEDLAPRQFHRGQMVRGVIMAKRDNEIIVDIGGKSEGIVPPQDLSRLDEEFLSRLNVGDEIVAYVLTPEGREGHVVLSLSQARAEYDWEQAKRWLENKTTIEAEVIETNRGGVVVRVGHLRGFVPGSQLVPRPETRGAASPEERFAPLKGQALKLKVIEVNRKRKRLILSEREAEREEREKRRQELLQELRKGEVRHGRVTSLTRFGAFVDLGGIDGLIHISELSWGRVDHPSDVLQVGDEVDVYVLDVDRERGRVSLSLRRLLPKPWETVLERYAIGQVVEGTVTQVVPFGAFVRLDDGIEGLVHISELANRYVSHPHEVVKEGDRVQVRILNIDPEARRMGLSIKQVDEEEYVEIDWVEADEEEEETLGTWEALADVVTEGEEDESPEAQEMSASTQGETEEEMDTPSDGDASDEEDEEESGGP